MKAKHADAIVSALAARGFSPDGGSPLDTMVLSRESVLDYQMSELISIVMRRRATLLYEGSGESARACVADVELVVAALLEVLERILDTDV